MTICTSVVRRDYGGEGGWWGGDGFEGEGKWVIGYWTEEAGGTAVNKHVELQWGTIILTVDY